jgi:hypothetical protein
MRFPPSIVADLTEVWARPHGSAAQYHLEYLIPERVSEVDGVGAYRRVLTVGAPGCVPTAAGDARPAIPRSAARHADGIARPAIIPGSAQ